MTSASEKSRVQGVFFGIAAAVTYGMNPLFALPLYSRGFTPDTVLICRYLPAALILAVWMAVRRESFALPGKEFLEACAAGLLFSASSLFLFMSYRKMDAGVASTLLFVYPVMVAFLMAGLYRERLTPGTWFSIALALGGIALLYRNAGGAPLDAIGILYVMLSSLSYAVYIVAVGKSALRNVPAVKLTFYVLVSGVVLYLVRIAMFGGFHFESTPVVWINVAGIAILPTVVSLVCTARAIGSAGATLTAILGALEPVTAVFFGVTVFHEKLTVRIVCGIVLILAAVVLIAAAKKDASPSALDKPARK